jgi:antitoxin HicB
MAKTDEHLDLRYHVSIVRDFTEDLGAGWVATVEEMPGCAGQGETPEAALTDLREAMAAWIEAVAEAGGKVPVARSEADRYSGQFRLRVPTGLHQALAEEAEREGVSMNMLVSSMLAGGLGWRRPKRMA